MEDGTQQIKEVQDPRYTLEVRTVQCKIINRLFDTLKEILTEVNLVFDPKGMKIMTIDGTKVALVHARLHSDRFEHYYCAYESIECGIEVSSFHKHIKEVDNKETLTFYILKESQNKLNIRRTNTEKCMVDTTSMNLLDIDAQKLTIPDKVFDFAINMPSSDFQSICKNMSNAGKTMEIIANNKQLKFKCEGDSATKTTILGQADTGMKCTNSDNAEEIIEGKYSLKFLLMFTKATSLSTNVELYMANEFPLIIQYSIGSLGELKFGISPKIEDLD